MKARDTQQRKEIIRVLTAARGPLSAHEIWLRGKVQQPKLGIATVYRCLKRLQDERQIRTVVLPSGESLYERVVSKHHHPFQCNRCREVTALAFCPQGLLDSIVLPSGHWIQGHEITFTGLCADCRTSKGDEHSPLDQGFTP